MASFGALVSGLALDRKKELRQIEVVICSSAKATNARAFHPAIESSDNYP